MMTNIWVKDKCSGSIHQVGTNVHDSLYSANGEVHYYNMQNGDGTFGGGYEFIDAPNSEDYISVTPKQLKINRDLLYKDLLKSAEKYIDKINDTETAIDLGKYIINKCINDNCPITNLQLQKILFIIQRNFLQNGKIAFHDESEAWRLGPAIPNVYYEFAGFGTEPIFIFQEGVTIKSDYKPIVDEIVEEKRTTSITELINETRKPKGAWAAVYSPKQRNVIPLDLIRDLG